MSDEFGPNFITITDEDGNDIELEYVDALDAGTVRPAEYVSDCDRGVQKCGF